MMILSNQIMTESSLTGPTLQELVIQVLGFVGFFLFLSLFVCFLVWFDFVVFIIKIMSYLLLFLRL